METMAKMKQLVVTAFNQLMGFGASKGDWQKAHKDLLIRIADLTVIMKLEDVSELYSEASLVAWVQSSGKIFVYKVRFDFELDMLVQGFQRADFSLDDELEGVNVFPLGTVITHQRVEK